MNAEQSSKKTLHRPTCPPLRGRLIGLGEVSKAVPQSLCRGSSDSMYTRGKRTQHGKPDSVVGRDDQPEAGDSQIGRYGVAERPVVPGKPGNAGGGKGP